MAMVRAVLYELYAIFGKPQSAQLHGWYQYQSAVSTVGQYRYGCTS